MTEKVVFKAPECMNSVNAGYEIIGATPKDEDRHYYIVLGQRKNAEGLITGYVTWEFNSHNGPDSFYWGHYFNKYSDALEDYCERLGHIF